MPAIDGVLGLLEGGEGISGGARRNRESAAAFTTFADGLAEPRRALVADPMTSGGLLIAVPAERAGEMDEALKRAAPETAAIGTLGEGEAGAITVE